MLRLSCWLATMPRMLAALPGRLAGVERACVGCFGACTTSPAYSVALPVSTVVEGSWRFAFEKMAENYLRRHCRLSKQTFCWLCYELEETRVPAHQRPFHGVELRAAVLRHRFAACRGLSEAKPSLELFTSLSPMLVTKSLSQILSLTGRRAG